MIELSSTYFVYDRQDKEEQNRAGMLFGKKKLGITPHLANLLKRYGL